jgi:hypothetical protein
MDLIGELTAGFSEGLVVPLVEFIASILITTAILISNTIPASSQNPPYFIPLMLLLFALMNIVENLVIGLGKIAYALSYCVGVGVGIYLFAPAIMSAYPQAVGSSIGIVVIVIIGICVKLYMISKRDE